MSHSDERSLSEEISPAVGIHNIMIANIPGHLRIWPLVNCHRHGQQVEKQDEEPFHKKSLHLIVLALFWCAI